MGSKGSQKTESTSTQTSRADPRAEALYTDVMARAQAAAAQPYQAYQGQMVAGFTPDQLAAMQGVRDVQGAYAPYFQTAAQFGERAGQAVSPAQIQAAMSPYLQGVIQPTMDVMTAEGQKAMSRLRGTEAQQGAFGGTRAAVAEANLTAEQERNKNLIVSDLMQKGYSQAVAQAQADRAAAGQGAQIMQGVAGAAQALPLQALGAELQTGALQQQLAQQQLNVPYQQFLEQRAYPYQQAQWLASIGQGLGPLLGGTSSGQSTTIATPAQPSLGSQIFGGLMSLAALPMTGGASLGGMGLSALGSGLGGMFGFGRADGGRVPHKADGGSVGMGDDAVMGAMAQALQLADAEMSQPQPAQMADGGAVPNAGDEIVQGALRLAQTMKRGLGGAADHMADGGVPGSTIGVIEVGGRKIPNIFPSSRLSGSSFRAPEVKYAPAGEIKTPDYSSITKGLGAAFKQPEPFTTFGSSQGQIGASQIGSKGLPSFKVGSDGQLPTLSGWSPVSSSSAPTPIDYSMYSMPEYGAPYAHGGIVPHHAKDGGLMFDPTPISEQVPDDVLPTVDRETAFTPEPITGEKIPQIAEVSMPRPRPQIGEEPTGELAREARALSNIESGGRYDIVGPVANKAGNRAYGKYQVMDFNVGPWTSRYYGTELTPQEFLRNPEAQEAVFKGEFGRLAGKYGSEGAAKAWFAGEGGMNQPGRRDVLGTTVADYARKFSAGLGEPRTAERAQEAFSQLNLGQGDVPKDLMSFSATGEPSGPQPAQYAGMSRFPEAAPATDVAPSTAPAPVAPPTQRQVATANRATSIFENLTGIQLSDEGRMAMMAMGLKMMTTPGSIGTAIGAGGLQGLATYTEAQRYAQEIALKERQRQVEERRITETERHQRAVEAENLRYHQQSLRAPKVYTDPDTGEQHAIMSTVNPDGTLNWFDQNLTKGTTSSIAAPTAQSTSTTPTVVSPPNKENIPKPGQGTIQNNQELVEKGNYDYRKDAPFLEKGMDVPEPMAVGGRSIESLKTDAEKYVLTGQLPTVKGGASPVAMRDTIYRNSVQNYGNALAASRGFTPAQLAEAHRSAPGMLRFVMGPDGRATVSLGTAIRHLDTIKQLAEAWSANDTRAINRIRTTLSREFGENAATNLNAAGSIVGPEIIKAIGVAGAGTKEERETAAAQFSSAASPKQLLGAVDTVQKLMGGQLEGRMRQAKAAGISDDMFKNLIGERPYEILRNAEKPAGAEPSAAAPAATAPAAKSGEAGSAQTPAAIKIDPRDAAAYKSNKEKYRNAINKKYGEGTSQKLDKE